MFPWCACLHEVGHGMGFPVLIGIYFQLSFVNFCFVLFGGLILDTLHSLVIPCGWYAVTHVNLIGVQNKSGFVMCHMLTVKVSTFYS